MQCKCQESACYTVVKEEPQQVKGPDLALEKYFSIIFYMKLNTLLDLLDMEGQLSFLSMLNHGALLFLSPRGMNNPCSHAHQKCHIVQSGRL